MINFCDRVEPYTEKDQIFWKAEKQLIRNGKRITAYETGNTPTKAKVKLYNLLTSILFFITLTAYPQQEQDCWYIYKSETKVDYMKADKWHGIKPGAKVYVKKISPGTHNIAFLDIEKKPSLLIIESCPESTILNIYNGQGRVKAYGKCQKNYITL